MSDLEPEPTFVLDKNEHFSERMSGVWIGYATWISSVLIWILTALIVGRQGI